MIIFGESNIILLKNIAYFKHSYKSILSINSINTHKSLSKWETCSLLLFLVRSYSLGTVIKSFKYLYKGKKCCDQTHDAHMYIIIICVWLLNNHWHLVLFCRFESLSLLSKNVISKLWRRWTSIESFVSVVCNCFKYILWNYTCSDFTRIAIRTTCEISLFEIIVCKELYMSRLMTKPTKWHVRPAKTHISLGIRTVWSESLLCAQWAAKDPSFLHEDSEDSDQTERIPRLISVFTGRTCHFVGFVMRRLILFIIITAFAALGAIVERKKNS